jgi:arsenate reductase-like glutaredoxin family protein
VVDTAAAIEFMLQTPTSIKRPIIEYQTGILKAFDEAQYGRALLK